jgi:hypothetical protein
MGLNQTNTFTFNRYAVKPGRQPGRQHGPHSEKPNTREMVVKKKVSGKQVSGSRFQVSGKTSANETTSLSLTPET